MNPPVVIDNGGYSIKAGFSGNGMHFPTLLYLFSSFSFLAFVYSISHDE
jgi:hypothetical protein